jgi:hypothetical protein
LSVSLAIPVTNEACASRSTDSVTPKRPAAATLPVP